MLVGGGTSLLLWEEEGGGERRQGEEHAVAVGGREVDAISFLSHGGAS